MFYTKCIAVAAILLLNDLTIAQDGQQWAEEQPSSAYTVYNGKVYLHPKKDDGFFANLFKLDAQKNPVIQTVLGWTDVWYGTPTNETEAVSPEPLVAQGSYNMPQYAASPYNNNYNQHRNYGGKFPLYNSQNGQNNYGQ